MSWVAFRRMMPSSKEGSSVAVPSTGPSARAAAARWVRDLLNQRTLVVGVLILLGYVGIAIAAWWAFPKTLGYMAPDIQVGIGFVLPNAPTLSFSPLSLGPYPLGQSGLFGFNVAEGLIKGTPWDLLLFTEILIPTAFLGLLLGVTAGGVGGAVEEVIMTLTDILLSIPTFIVALLLFVVVLPALHGFVVPEVFALTMVLVSWPAYARIVRAKARQVSRQPFIEASIASGATRSRVLWRHIMPNSVAPMFSQVPITLSNLIALMVTIPYIGILSSGQFLQVVLFTPSTTFPEWTWMLVNGLRGWSGLTQTDAWWGYVFPILWIMGFVLGVMLLCDGLENFLSRRG